MMRVSASPIARGANPPGPGAFCRAEEEDEAQHDLRDERGGHSVALR